MTSTPTTSRAGSWPARRRRLVLAVDYRLGPEHRFPAAVEDALAAFRWAHAEAATLGADPERIAVAGDSAGGNLAAVSRPAHRRRADGPAPAFQALLYPVTDYSVKRRSYELFGEGFFLTREEMDWFRDNYFADPSASDPRASPLLAADLAGVAPAHVVTAGFDPLRDEGEAYAERLLEHGVPTTLRRERDLVHGFVNAVGLGGRAREATGAFAAALREGLDQAPDAALGPAVAAGSCPAWSAVVERRSRRAPAPSRARGRRSALRDQVASSNGRCGRSRRR